MATTMLVTIVVLCVWLKIHSRIVTDKHLLRSSIDLFRAVVNLRTQEDGSYW